MVDIQPLTEDTVPAYRMLRKQAHQTDSLAFWGGYVHEETLSDEEILEDCSTSCLKNIFIATVDGKIAGTIGVSKINGSLGVKSYAWIQFFFVTPEMRGQKIGKQLLEHAIKHIRRFKKIKTTRLAVVETQEKAISLYNHFHFKEYAREWFKKPYNGRYLQYIVLEKRH